MTYKITDLANGLCTVYGNTTMVGRVLKLAFPNCHIENLEKTRIENQSEFFHAESDNHNKWTSSHQAPELPQQSAILFLGLRELKQELAALVRDAEMRNIISTYTTAVICDGETFIYNNKN